MEDLLGLLPGDQVTRHTFVKSQLQCYHFDESPYVNAVASELFHQCDRNLYGNVIVTGLNNTLLSRARAYELSAKCARIHFLRFGSMQLRLRWQDHDRRHSINRL